MYTTHIESFGGILALSVCVCWVYSTLPILGFQVMIWPTTWRKFPPYLYKFCTHYSGEWVQGKSPLSQTLILKLPRTNKKKGGKVDKVFFCFFFSTGNITWCASTKTDWSCLLCDTTCAWLQLTISGHCIQWLFRAKFQHSYNFHSFRYITCHALWWSWHFLHKPSF